MKKWLIGIFVLAVLIICGIYLLIPSTITVSNVRYVKAYQNTVLKFLTDNSKMNEWLQASGSKTNTGIQYKGFNYNISSILSNVIEVDIQTEKEKLNSHIVPVNIYLDSTGIQWSTQLKAGNNPFDRISKYREAVRLKESMAGLMDEMKKELDNSANMYGIHIKEVQFEDSVLITTKIITAIYPTVTDVYTQVQKLKDYANAQQVKIIDVPMQYVKQAEDGKHYEVMIGLAINKLIAGNDDIRIKRMPYGGNMFMAEIKGGPYIIQQGLMQLNTFLIDSKRVSPAIPFEAMQTDRSKETDTTKWVTRLFYPVM